MSSSPPKPKNSLWLWTATSRPHAEPTILRRDEHGELGPVQIVGDGLASAHNEMPDSAVNIDVRYPHLVIDGHRKRVRQVPRLWRAQ